jgi:hypothetical protein
LAWFLLFGGEEFFRFLTFFFVRRLVIIISIGIHRVILSSKCMETLHKPLSAFTAQKPYDEDKDDPTLIRNIHVGLRYRQAGHTIKPQNYFPHFPNRYRNPQ